MAAALSAAQWDKEMAERVENPFADLKHDHERFQKAAHALYDTQSKCVSLLTKLRKQGKELNYMLKQSKKSKAMTASEVVHAERRLHEKSLQFDKMAESFPSPISNSLYLLTGNVNVTLPQIGDRLKYKQEYENFKRTLTFIIIAMSVICYWFPFRLLASVFNLFLCYYYIALAVRENILIANGSRIRGWWLIHHYTSVVLSGIILVWPDGDSYLKFTHQFMLFMMCLGVAQLLQYTYQKAELYKKAALGKTKSLMDTTTDFPMKRGFTTLVVINLGVYVFQLYNAYLLGRFWFHDGVTGDWQAFGAAVVLAFLGVGNIVTTMRVIHWKYKQWMLTKPVKKGQQ